MTVPAPDNPILRRLELARFSFRGSWPAPNLNTRLVCLDSAGRVYPVESLPTHGERLFHSFTVYEIDTGEHSPTLTTTLPCEEEAFSFGARLDVTWAVRDPVVVARRNIQDARAVYWPFLMGLLRSLGREHSVEHSAAAEEAMNRALAAAPFALDEPEDTGLAVVRASIQLVLDGGAQKHVAMRTEARRRTEREDLEHQRKLVAAEQGLAEAAVEKRLAAARAAHQQELAAQEARHRRQLAELTADQDIAIKRKRMGFYREALDQGDYGLIILQLTEHPDDVAGVIELVQRHQEINFRNSREMVQAFLDAGRANNADIHPAWQKALASLLESLQAPVATIGQLRRPDGIDEPVAGIPAAETAEPVDPLDPPDVVTAEVVKDGEVIEDDEDEDGDD